MVSNRKVNRGKRNQVKTIVLYNVDKETIKKYQEIKELEDIQFKQIFDEDLQVTIEDLFDLPSACPNRL